MITDLKLLKHTREFKFFELPKIVVYNDTSYKMTCTANLVYALNRDGLCLNDIFDIGSEPAKILRRKIRVQTTDIEKATWNNRIQNEKYEKHRIRECCVCGVRCERSFYMIGTCSDHCRQIKILERNAIVAATHWCKSENADEIRDKRIQTRLENDILLNRQYIPWNKGKTGIYSPETIQKISDAALKQFHEKKFHKTKVEQVYENILISFDIKYIYSYIFERRQFDFYLPDIKTFIEIHGDFWHGNPSIYGSVTKPLREHQKIKRLDDGVKKRLVEDSGYSYIEFWENDVYKNVAVVIEKTSELLK